MKLNWRFRDVWERSVLVIDKDERRRELSLLDLEQRLPYTVDVPSNINIENIQRGRMYRVRLNVYVAKQTREFRRQLEEVAERDEEVRRMLEILKKLGGGDFLFRFELADIRSIHYDLAKRTFEPYLDFHKQYKNLRSLGSEWL